MFEKMFRGVMKSENDIYKKGEWVFGDLVWLEDGKKKIPCIYGKGEVFKDTIGMCSLLTDVNNRLIYTGDVLEWTDSDGARHTETVSFKGGCFVIKGDCEIPELLEDVLPLGMRVIGTLN